MMRFGGAIGLLAGGTSAAWAQVDGVGTWLWEVTTESGDAIVEPGETATITLSMDMDPDVNYPGGPVLSFASAIFDTLGQANADKGHIVGWEILNNLDALTGDLTTTDGVSLFGTNAGQSLQGAVIDDPIAVFTYSWTPDVAGHYEVSYATSTEVFAVWTGEPPFGGELVFWPVVAAEISFAVVPSPSVVAMTCLGGLWLLARRRHR